jgi:hypothetical protein
MLTFVFLTGYDVFRFADFGYDVFRSADFGFSDFGYVFRCPDFGLKSLKIKLSLFQAYHCRQIKS